MNISFYPRYTYQLTFYIYRESSIKEYKEVVTFKSRKKARKDIKLFKRDIFSKFSDIKEFEVKEVTRLPYREDFALAMKEIGYDPVHQNIKSAIEQIQKKMNFKPIKSKDRERQDCRKLIGKSVFINADKTNTRCGQRFLYKNVIIDYLEEVNGLYHNFYLKADHIWAEEHFNFSTQLGNSKIGFVATCQEYERKNSSKSVGFISAKQETKEYINELLMASILFYRGGTIQSNYNVAFKFLNYIYHGIGEEVRKAFEIASSSTENRQICIHFQKLLDFVGEIYSLAVECVGNLKPGDVYIVFEEFIHTGKIIPGMSIK